jgi:hypothetical protein
MPDSLGRGACPNLNFLRSGAVLMVLFTYQPPYQALPLRPIRRYRLFGVLLFFVHTSLVLIGRLCSRQRFLRPQVFPDLPLSILAVLTAVALHLHADGRGLSFGQRPGALELVSNRISRQLLARDNLVFMSRGGSSGRAGCRGNGGQRHGTRWQCHCDREESRPETGKPMS